jgi:hypothetical protein
MQSAARPGSILAILAFAGMIRGVHLGLRDGSAAGLDPFHLCGLHDLDLRLTEMRWVESLIAAVAMTAFCVRLFVYLLQLPFQLWPWY